MPRATGLNHAVLFVRDTDASTRFYVDVLGLEPVATGQGIVLLRAAGSGNHHDLGLVPVGADAPSPPPGATGLYHLAWQVASITELAAVRETLRGCGAYVGESDHGATKSVYGRDPDGNELEVLFQLPRDSWGEHGHAATTAPLDLEAELERWG